MSWISEFRGPPGPMGPPGPCGMTGRDGEDGVDGMDGRDGKDANYDIVRVMIRQELHRVHFVAVTVACCMVPLTMATMVGGFMVWYYWHTL